MRGAYAEIAPECNVCNAFEGSKIPSNCLGSGCAEEQSLGRLVDAPDVNRLLTGFKGYRDDCRSDNKAG